MVEKREINCITCVWNIFKNPYWLDYLNHISYSFLHSNLSTDYDLVILKSVQKEKIKIKQS